MKKKDKKLVLSKETIAALEGNQLIRAIGGLSTGACTESSCYCPTMD